jgi:hypothetical protein
VVDKSISLTGEDMSNTIISGGVLMDFLNAKASERSIQTLQNAKGISEAELSLFNFALPRTTFMYVNSSDVTLSGLTIKGGDKTTMSLVIFIKSFSEYTTNCRYLVI